MYSKVISFRSAVAVFPRSVYFLNGEIASHRDLESLQRWYYGPGVKGVFSLHRLAREALAWTRGQKQRPREYAYFELIISSPENAQLSDQELSGLVIDTMDAFGVVGAMVGVHRHKNGRVDVHIFCVNGTLGGSAIGVDVTLPSTGRRFRNVEVALREFVDEAHESLNLARAAIGRPHIETIPELRAAAREQRRMRDIAAAALRADHLSLSESRVIESVVATAISVAEMPAESAGTEPLGNALPPSPPIDRVPSETARGEAEPPASQLSIPNSAQSSAGEVSPSMSGARVPATPLMLQQNGQGNPRGARLRR